MENMNTNVNVELNSELLVSSEEARQQALDLLSNSDAYTLRKSAMWTKLNPDGFKTVCGVYMTVNQVADFFGVDKNALKNYTRKEQHGEINTYRQELINAGVLTLSNEECKNMIENFVVFQEHHENLPGDETDSWKPNSRGAVLYSLNAVTKLGMFMTGTASAIKFRDLIIEELTKEVKFEEAYQTVLDGYLNQMHISASNNEIFDTKILNSVMDAVSDTSLICYKQDIIKTINKLNEIRDIYDELLEACKQQGKRLIKVQVQSIIEQLTISISELQQVIIELDSVRLNANTAKELYNRSEIIKDAVLQKPNESSREYNARITQLTSLLEMAGYVSIEEDYQAPQRDAQGRKITLDLNQCDSKTNVFIDINGVQHDGTRTLKYVAGEEGKEWIFNNEYVLNRDTKHQVLKYTPVGRSLWGALYRQADTVYDEVVKKYTDKEGKLDLGKVRQFIDRKPKSLVKACQDNIDLTKEEFEAQYAYAIINNKTNTIVLL